MTAEIVVFLFVAGLLAGAQNSVAGGGSFIAFPALLFVGVPPVPANATNTVALWMGMAASGGAYREKLDVPRKLLLTLLTASFVGGGLGAILLLRTPAHTFLRVLPWLTLGATLLFTFGKRTPRKNSSDVATEATKAALAGAGLFQLVVAIYGGYFGGGMGILILAMLAMMGMADIHAMNALKTVTGFVINGVAVVTFVVAKAVYWPQALVMTVGAIAGGYFGAHYAQRLPQSWIRRFVIAVGSTMTVYFFVKAY